MPDICLEKLPSFVSALQQEALLVHANDGSSCLTQVPILTIISGHKVPGENFCKTIFITSKL